MEKINIYCIKPILDENDEMFCDINTGFYYVESKSSAKIITEFYKGSSFINRKQIRLFQDDFVWARGKKDDNTLDIFVSDQEYFMNEYFVDEKTWKRQKLIEEIIDD